MRFKPLIGSVIFNVLGLYRVAMDVLGDVDMVHTLTDKGSWLYAYGPILIGLILLAWSLWPNRKASPVSEEKPKGQTGIIQEGGHLNNLGRIAIKGGDTGYHLKGGTFDNRGTVDIKPGGDMSLEIEHLTDGPIPPKAAEHEPPRKAKGSVGWGPGFEMPWLKKKPDGE